MHAETCSTPDRGWMGDRRRGASMGRSAVMTDRETSVRFYLRKVARDSQGYDRGGAYWGCGGELYEAFTADGAEFLTLWLNSAKRTEIANRMRENGDDPLEYGSAALDRRTAKAQVWAEYPNATFFQ